MTDLVHVKFINDFDHYPSFLVTIAYRAGTVTEVPPEVAALAIKLGAAVEIQSPEVAANADAVSGENEIEPSL